MSATLVSDSYGKSAIRLVKVTRAGGGPRHDVRELTVDVRFEGSFERAHTDGDNTAILPTDTMKNTVYALARTHDLKHPEEFGMALGERFLAASPAATRVRVSIAAARWERVSVAGRPHDHSFVSGGAERRLVAVWSERGSATIEAGIADLEVMKTSGSGFAGFLRDEYTTLADTSDRILATSVTARWRYAHVPESLGTIWHGVRQSLLETFAEHDSRSVQHTLHAMGSAVLSQFADVEEIRISLPNRHHLLVNLTPFGLINENEIFVATSEPYGLIEGVMRRE